MILDLLLVIGSLLVDSWQLRCPEPFDYAQDKLRRRVGWQLAVGSCGALSPSTTLRINSVEGLVWQLAVGSCGALSPSTTLRAQG
ncbi:MAG: hypothetical protein WBL95_26070, partial [Microcoleus sp.]